MTIHPSLKLSALIVTILGLLVALELASMTTKQVKTTPILATHHFSNMLGFFPAITHRATPKVALLLGQSVASQAVDQTWLEKAGPKMVTSAQLPLISTTSNAQQGSIKTYLSLFFITLCLATLAASL